MVEKGLAKGFRCQKSDHGVCRCAPISCMSCIQAELHAHGSLESLGFALSLFAVDANGAFLRPRSERPCGLNYRVYIRRYSFNRMPRQTNPNTSSYVAHECGYNGPTTSLPVFTLVVEVIGPFIANRDVDLLWICLKLRRVPRSMREGSKELAVLVSATVAIAAIAGLSMMSFVLRLHQSPPPIEPFFRTI